MIGALNGLSTVEQGAILLGSLFLCLLIWWTIRRFAWGSNEDPSVSAGGDWVLVRASGPALIVIVAAATAILFAPVANLPLFGLLAGITLAWIWSKEEEMEGDL